MEEFYVREFDAERVNALLDQWGVCVITHHFARAQAHAWKDGVRRWLCAHSDGRLRPNKAVWKDERLPYGPRSGMFQSLVSNAPAMWEIREALHPLFTALHGNEQLLTSLDGASVYPVEERAAAPDDWAHIDQTVPGLRCVQGQVVLSDSLAAFRCTPTSHARHEEVLQLCGLSLEVPDRGNWLKFNKKTLPPVQALFDRGMWQMPVHAPAGAVILWRSSTIHSATPCMEPRAAIAPLVAQWQEEARAEGGGGRQSKFGARAKSPWDGWRCVVYVTERPAAEFSYAQVERLAQAARTGHMTNHWGTKIFSVPARQLNRKVPAVQHLLRHPEETRLPQEEMTPLQRRLAALEPWDGADE